MSEEQPAAEDVCAICGRDLWSDGLPPAPDGDAWICGDCDAARNFATLDLRGDAAHDHPHHARRTERQATTRGALRVARW